MPDSKPGPWAQFSRAFVQTLRLLGGSSPAVVFGVDLLGVITQVIREQAPSPPETFEKNAAEAAEALSRAGQILSTLESELGERKARLDEVLREIEVKRKEADHFAALASLNQQQASALTVEVERRVREQIRKEQHRNRGWRRAAGFVIWFVTLIAGAVAGVALQEIWDKGLLNLPFSERPVQGSANSGATPEAERATIVEICIPPPHVAALGQSQKVPATWGQGPLRRTIGV